MHWATNYSISHSVVYLILLIIKFTWTKFYLSILQLPCLYLFFKSISHHKCEKWEKLTLMTKKERDIKIILLKSVLFYFEVIYLIFFFVHIIKVTMYMHAYLSNYNNCSKCSVVKRFLRSLNILFIVLKSLSTVAVLIGSHKNISAANDNYAILISASSVCSHSEKTSYILLIYQWV